MILLSRDSIPWYTISLTSFIFTYFSTPIAPFARVSPSEYKEPQGFFYFFILTISSENGPGEVHSSLNRFSSSAFKPFTSFLYSYLKKLKRSRAIISVSCLNSSHLIPNCALLALAKSSRCRQTLFTKHYSVRRIALNFPKSQTNSFSISLKEQSVMIYRIKITKGHAINLILLAPSDEVERNVRTIQAPPWKCVYRTSRTLDALSTTSSKSMRSAILLKNSLPESLYCSPVTLSWLVQKQLKSP